MQPMQKVPIVLAALLFVLAAIAEIATGRSQGAGDTDTMEQNRRAALTQVDEALARQDLMEARRASQAAYELARQSRSWRALVDAADAYRRIAAASTLQAPAATSRAREIYLAALTRARAERSVEGVLRAAEGFAALGDREVAEQALHVAAKLAARARDAAAPTTVEMARGRLLEGPGAGITRAAF